MTTRSTGACAIATRACCGSIATSSGYAGTWTTRPAGSRDRTWPSFASIREARILAYHRWEEGGPRDDVIVLANFSSVARDRYRIGVPRQGLWRVRCNSDWDGYDQDFATEPALDAESEDEPLDGLGQSISVGVGPYTVVILSQDD